MKGRAFVFAAALVALGLGFGSSARIADSAGQGRPLAGPLTANQDPVLRADHSAPVDAGSYHTMTNGVSPLPDRDYDGLTDITETYGWRNESGHFTTDPLDADTDNDGLTDGEEKLFETSPLDETSPGIYVVYTTDLMTSKYFPWERHGGKFIAFNAAIVRRGATFYVGGPAEATIQVNKSQSSLTPLSVQRDVCQGRWLLTVPMDGTVGKYTVTLTKGAWSQSLNLYIIFELPTGMSGADVAAYLYSDDPTNSRDEYAIWYMTTNDYNNEWRRNRAYHRAKGRGMAFQTDHYQSYVFENHIIEAINGHTDPSTAVEALGHRLDGILRFSSTSLRYNMWSTLHAANKKAQCSTHAAAMTSFSRGAGIPSRPVVVDWDMHVVGPMLFDHSTEVWLSNDWKVMRAYKSDESNPGSPIAKGIYPPRDRSNWFYPDSRGDIIAVADSNWNWAHVETNSQGDRQKDYIFGNYDNTRIVRWDWVDTEVLPYGWGWSQEPIDIGDPDSATVPWPSGLLTETEQKSPELRNKKDGLRSSRVRLGQVVADYGVDLDLDGHFDQLVIDVELDVSQPGYYTVGGFLSSPDFRSFAKTAALASTAVHIRLEDGVQTVSLAFDGTSISSAHVDGPFNVTDLWVSDLGLDSDPNAYLIDALDHRDPFYTTAPYRYRDFDGPDAALTDRYTEYGVDGDRDGLFESLIIDVEWESSIAGTYTILGDLYDGRGQFISRVEWTGSQSPASLRFERIPGTLGPYTLRELYLTSVDGEILDSRFSGYTTDYVTAGEGLTHILGETPLGELGFLPSPYADDGIDLNENGLYDLLEIRVQVEVEEADQYRIEGWLEAENGALIAWASSDLADRSVGIQDISLVFSGPTIRDHNADGPFTLTALKLVRGRGYNVVDEVAVAYTTANYGPEQFERASHYAIDQVLFFEDTMESGGGNWAAELPWALVTSQSHSPMHAWTDSPAGDYGDGVSTALATFPINLGEAGPLVLQFQTCHDLQLDRDYGYVEISTDQGASWTGVATYTGTTAHWSHEEVNLGLMDGTETPQVRFRLDSDASGTADGWYIDDVSVFTVRESVPVAAFSTSSPNVLGEMTTFTNYSTGGNLTYAWSFGDGSPTSSGMHTNHTYASAGTFTVTLTVTNSLGSSMAMGQVVIHDVPPNAAFSSSSPDYLGEATSFQNASTGGNLSYAWDFGDGSSISTAVHPTHTFSTSGTFTVVLTATNSAGSDTVSAQVIIEEPPSVAFYFSLSNGGSYTVGNVTAVRNEDILSFDGTSFAMLFDGSDVGIRGNIDGIHIVDSDTLYFSLTASSTVPGLGTVDDSDIIQFDATSFGEDTAGTFHLFFDGSDVGLTYNGEDVDAFALAPDGRLLISTSGDPYVSGVTGKDEDLLAFTPVSLGTNTAGSWEMYFDGSDVGLATTSDEDVDGVSVAGHTEIYLTTRGDFAVSGVSGHDEDLFHCTPTELGSSTNCIFSSTLFFDGSTWGLSSDDVDALHIVD